MSISTTHVYRRSIRFSETDAAGVAHFSRLLVIIEEAVHDFFQSRSVPIMDSKTAWPVVSIHADYSKGFLFQDEIIIFLSMDRINTSSLVLSFTAAKADGTACFRGKTTLCHIDPALHAPAPIPAKTRDALSATPE
jgi:acyl-CoA thioester hydrolase